MLDILMFSLTRGAVYALVAVGFVLIFSVGGILNLAHGTFFMLGAYFTYIYYAEVIGEPNLMALLLSMTLAIVTVALFAVLIYRYLYQRRIESISYVMVISLAIALLVSEVMSLLYGVTGTSVPPIIRGSQIVLGTRVLNQELLILPICAFVLVGLLVFLHYTKIGKAITAVAQNQEGARLVGINSAYILGLTIFISAALAALAGTLVSSLYTVVPDMWVFWLIKAFAIAIVGGLGSIYGAIIAAFLLSFAEVVTFTLTSEQYADLVALGIIVAILVFKPSGLMGTRRI